MKNQLRSRELVRSDGSLSLVDNKSDEIEIDNNISYNYPKDLLLSIVIPLYNEENTIKDIINKIPNHFQNEIIIVNDGSTDNSVQRITEIKDKNIVLINHKRNEGYGAAILTGIKKAKGDIIVTMDSDGQHNPEEIAKIIQPLLNDSADIVIGSRYLGKLNFKIPLHVKIAEIIIKLFMKLLYGQVIHNNQNGFRAFKRNTIKIFEDLRYTGMGFTTEVLLYSAYKGYKIKEIPITANSREYGDSYVKKIKTMKSILSIMLFYFFRNFNLNINKLFLKRILDKIYRKVKYLEIFQ